MRLLYFMHVIRMYLIVFSKSVVGNTELSIKAAE